MAHGYMREFDEDRGNERDRWRDEDRERSWRGRDEDRERSWRGSDESRNDRNLGFMLGDRDRSWEQSSRRGQNMGQSDWSRTGGVQAGWDRDQRESGWSDNQRGGRSSHQDDHYRSWRDKQMQSLDQDYDDYCREREQQFHSDFDSWRSQRRERHGNPEPLRTGMTQTGLSADPSGMTQLNEDADQTADQPDPIADATMGNLSSRTRR